MKRKSFIKKIFLLAILAITSIVSLNTYAEEFLRLQNDDDLWEVLRSNFHLYRYEENPLVKEQINYFMNHQDFLLNSANRAAPYLYYIFQEARKRHLPAEIVLIPIIESAFNPFAYSHAGAAGIWQMMPQTASGYGVKQNWWYDGRRDVITSTKAALNHVVYLRHFFNNNWLLILAAYDFGQGNVLNAIKRNIRGGYDTNFWGLPLAKETRNYVPRFLALATIIAHPEKYPVYLPPVKNEPYLSQVDVGRQIDLHNAAKLAGVSLRYLMQLNPGFNRMVTAPNGPYRITLPIENVAFFTQNLNRLPNKPALRWRSYKVLPGDTILALAKRYNSSPFLLKKLNHLASNHLQVGTTLLLPRPDRNIFLAKNISYTSKKSSLHHLVVKHSPEEILLRDALLHVNYKLQPGDTVYMARNGDTLSTVATHFKIPVISLIAANSLRDRKLHAGQHLVIPTHHTDVRFASHRVTHTTMKPGDTLYMVRAGDTFEKIANRFHITAPEIRLVNLMADNELRPGDQLVIPARG